MKTVAACVLVLGLVASTHAAADSLDAALEKGVFSAANLAQWGYCYSDTAACVKRYNACVRSIAPAKRTTATWTFCADVATYPHYMRVFLAEQRSDMRKMRREWAAEKARQAPQS